MRNLLYVLVAALGTAACTNQPEKSTGFADTTSAVNTSVNSGYEETVKPLCFQRLTGTSNQDTTKLQLVINGNQVRGNFSHHPKEKDSRVGTLVAKKDGELIKGTWTYMQEGANDTLQVEFKLNGDNLSQKSYTVDPKTGREVLSQSATYNVSFEKITCKN